MKDEPIKRIFKNCTIKFTECQRIRANEYKYYSVKKENVYVFTNSKNKSIQYVDFADGFCMKTKRSKSLKITGGNEITQSQYDEDKNNWEAMK